MTLLFDQNISFHVIHKIRTVFPDAKQVREVGLEDATDIEIWRFARDHHYTIVSFDTDFYDLIQLNGHPPKIIWLRTGNLRTDEIAQLFIKRFELIRDFIEESLPEKPACLTLA